MEGYQAYAFAHELTKLHSAFRVEGRMPFQAIEIPNNRSGMFQDGVIVGPSVWTRLYADIGLILDVWRRFRRAFSAQMPFGKSC